MLVYYKNIKDVLIISVNQKEESFNLFFKHFEKRN